MISLINCLSWDVNEAAVVATIACLVPPALANSLNLFLPAAEIPVPNATVKVEIWWLLKRFFAELNAGLWLYQSPSPITKT